MRSEEIFLSQTLFALETISQGTLAPHVGWHLFPILPPTMPLAKRKGREVEAAGTALGHERLTLIDLPELSGFVRKGVLRTMGSKPTFSSFCLVTKGTRAGARNIPLTDLFKLGSLFLRKRASGGPLSAWPERGERASQGGGFRFPPP